MSGDNRSKSSKDTGKDWDEVVDLSADSDDADEKRKRTEEKSTPRRSATAARGK